MSSSQPLPATDFHVLLVLSQGELYGYAIKKSLAIESGGTITPEIGSLYRVLGRLVSQGWVEQVDGSRVDEAPHPGRQRKYYALTRAGERALSDEALRMSGALEIARERGLLPGASS